MDPRVPVLIGGGQVNQRDGDGDLDPVGLMTEALRRAAADAGVADPSGLLARADTIAAVNVISWHYRDPASLVAGLLGATPARTWYTTAAGSSPQALVSRAALDISAGRADLVLDLRRGGVADPDAAAQGGPPPRLDRAARGRGAGLDAGRGVPADGPRRRGPPRRDDARAGVPAVRERAPGHRRPHAGGAPRPRLRALGRVQRGRRRPTRTRGSSGPTRPRRSAPSGPTTAWSAGRTPSS